MYPCFPVKQMSWVTALEYLLIIFMSGNRASFSDFRGVWRSNNNADCARCRAFMRSSGTKLSEKSTFFLRSLLTHLVFTN